MNPRSSRDRVETVTVTVRFAETDQQGVAYHANYFVWMEIGRTRYLKALGFPYDQMERDGTLFAVSEATCTYRGAARYEETVTIETRVEAVRSRSVVFVYDLSVHDRKIAEGTTTLISIDSERRPIRIPERIAAALVDDGGSQVV